MLEKTLALYHGEYDEYYLVDSDGVKLRDEQHAKDAAKWARMFGHPVRAVYIYTDGEEVRAADGSFLGHVGELLNS